MQRGAALYSGQPSEGYLVMAEATPRIGAQWLASQGSFACGEAQDDMSSIGETLWMQHCSQIIDLIQRHYRGGNTVRGKLEGRLATWLQVQVPSSISTPLWSRDQAQDLWPSFCPPFFLPRIPLADLLFASTPSQMIFQILPSMLGSSH
jgi:hypothetical protein